VLIIDVVLFNHKIASFILVYWPFKHQIHKIVVLVMVTLIFVILLTWEYHKFIKSEPGEAATFLTYDKHCPMLDLEVAIMVLALTVRTHHLCTTPYEVYTAYLCDLYCSLKFGGFLHSTWAQREIMKLDGIIQELWTTDPIISREDMSCDSCLAYTDTA